jgi:hypothetical protein
MRQRTASKLRARPVDASVVLLPLCDHRHRRERHTRIDVLREHIIRWTTSNWILLLNLFVKSNSSNPIFAILFFSSPRTLTTTIPSLGSRSYSPHKQHPAQCGQTVSRDGDASSRDRAKERRAVEERGGFRGARAGEVARIWAGNGELE